MPEVLGRVITGERTLPRGPDAYYRIRVPKAWLEEGATVEFEVPRHLTCKACDGGGCDACERSGALTVRGRDELPNLLTLKLPAAGDKDSFVVRIPEQGGFPPPGSDLPRGFLLLRVEAGSSPDASTTVMRHQVTPAHETPATSEPAQPNHDTRMLLVALGMFVVASVLFWLLMR